MIIYAEKPKQQQKSTLETNKRVHSKVLEYKFNIWKSICFLPTCN